MSPLIPSRSCTVCGQVLFESLFRRRARSLDGLSTTCSPCADAQAQATLLAAYRALEGLPCAVCGARGAPKRVLPGPGRMPCNVRTLMRSSRPKRAALIDRFHVICREPHDGPPVPSAPPSPTTKG